MIQISCPDLPSDTLRFLADLQAIINVIPDYQKKVEEAERLFENRTDNRHFRLIKSELTNMCSGARRCHYCEDSCADEVEHFKPKNIYPEETFVWDNYLYACGTCNSPKGNRFAVFSDESGEFVEIVREKRKKGEPPVPIFPPEPGTPVLINPRVEDPLEFMDLDLLGTFFFLPRGAADSEIYARAEYTIRILRLNDRDYLPIARQEAYYSYLDCLSRYISDRDYGKSERVVEGKIQSLKRKQHPTVWREMKRQNALIPELERLFTEAPEALDW